MYIVEKTFEFSAAHALTHLPENHPCHKMHGHNYKVTFTFKSDKLNKDKFVIDYRMIKELVQPIINLLDHSNLNESFVYTTSEVMAKSIFEQIKGSNPLLYSVAISETESTKAIYYES
jgi:6-pyruvoyltetrahydropterin/6-carboxytetrahydropterin synthase